MLPTKEEEVIDAAIEELKRQLRAWQRVSLAVKEAVQAVADTPLPRPSPLAGPPTDGIRHVETLFNHLRHVSAAAQEHANILQQAAAAAEPGATDYDDLPPLVPASDSEPDDDDDLPPLVPASDSEPDDEDEIGVPSAFMDELD
jgi:hypothetical protein